MAELRAYAGRVKAIRGSTCDVCSVGEQFAGDGGAAFLDGDGSWSYVCEECYRRFCTLSPDSRRGLYGRMTFSDAEGDAFRAQVTGDVPARLRDYGRKTSMEMGVGTDPRVVASATVFDALVPFGFSVLAHGASLRAAGKKAEMCWTITRESPHISAATTRAERAMAQFCRNPACPNRARTVEFSLCVRCLVTAYCSRQCQMADYRRHRPACLYAAEVLAHGEGKK